MTTPPTAAHLQASLRFAPDLLTRAQGVKLVLFDVDGVLTDGGLMIAETPPGDPRIADETLKRFNTLDGLGLQLLQRAGITPAVISGRDGRPLRQRLAKLGIVHAYFGQDRKLPAAQTLMQELGLGWDKVAAMGDDWPDLPLMCKSALAVAPPGAHPEVLSVAHYQTQARAGYGAARELCDLLLVANGCYQTLLNEFALGE